MVAPTASEIEAMRDKVCYGAADLSNELFRLSAENKRLKIEICELQERINELVAKDE